MADSGAQNTTVLVVMAVHNRMQITDQCLKRLQNQSFENIKVIVVDDGSTDGTAEMIQTAHPDTHLLFGNGHYWWSKCMNIGIKYALKSAQEADIILTLNDDTIFDEHYIQTMVTDMGNDRKTIMGSLIIINDQDYKVFFAGARFDPWFSGDVPNYRMGAMFDDFDQHFIETDYIPGRGTAFPVSVFKDIGFYDEKNLPHYWADYDFTLRAKKAGYRLLINTRALIKTDADVPGKTNFGKRLKKILSSFTDVKSTDMLRDRYYYSKKHAKIPLLYFPLLVTKQMIKSLLYLFTEKQF